MLSMPSAFYKFNFLILNLTSNSEKGAFKYSEIRVHSLEVNYNKVVDKDYTNN